MEEQQLRAMIDRFLRGESSPEEDVLLQKLLEDTNDPDDWDTAVLGAKQKLRDKMLARLRASIKSESSASPEIPKRSRMNRWWWSAAVVLIGFGIGLWTFVQQENAASVARSTKYQVLQPGGDKASLQLSGGQVLELDSSKNGATFQRIASLAVPDTAVVEQIPNVLITPRGGQFKLELPDGTLVWLNSDSKLSFPSRFTGGHREVRLEGEAYFEVARNPDQPFIVHTAYTRTRVLGTHFNVRAYPGAGQIRTTLMEGSVEVQALGQKLQLRPGRMASFDVSNQRLVQSDADLSAALAWKNGYFIFNDQNIKDIMTELARWYDAEIVYKGDLDSKDFSARISKRKNIEEILDLLEMTYAIRFKIEERRITVMP